MNANGQTATLQYLKRMWNNKNTGESEEQLVKIQHRVTRNYPVIYQ